MKRHRQAATGSRILSGAIVLGTILAMGCLFEPRTAPEPSSDSVPWIRPISVVNVMENMRNAVNRLSDTNYSNSLGESFIFKASTTDTNEAPAGYFEEFGKTRELAALRKLFNQVDSLRINWNFDENVDLTEIGNDATLRLENYQLFVSYSESDQVIYSGKAWLRLKYDDEGDQWFLVDWDESQDNVDQSWGRLRAILDI